MVLFLTDRKSPVPTRMAPPAPVAAFPSRVTPSRERSVAVPDWLTAPPPAAGLPPVSRTPVRVRDGLAVSRIRKLVTAVGARRTVSRLAPGPVTVRAPPPAGICGRGDNRLMVL